jgi:hypothetical protein
LLPRRAGRSRGEAEDDASRRPACRGDSTLRSVRRSKQTRGRRAATPCSSTSVVFGRGAFLLGSGRRRDYATSPTLARRFPVGLGDTPLPAGTSAARTAICHCRTTSFPRLPASYGLPQDGSHRCHRRVAGAPLVGSARAGKAGAASGVGGAAATQRREDDRQLEAAVERDGDAREIRIGLPRA